MSEARRGSSVLVIIPWLIVIMILIMGNERDINDLQGQIELLKIEKAVER